MGMSLTFPGWGLQAELLCFVSEGHCNASSEGTCGAGVLQGEPGAIWSVLLLLEELSGVACKEPHLCHELFTRSFLGDFFPQQRTELQRMHVRIFHGREVLY